MPRYINTSVLTLDGPTSTADQFSQEVDLTAQNDSIPQAFYLPVAVNAAGVMACTLQFNPDPSGSSDLGWQDLTGPEYTIWDTTANSVLATTNAGISSGAVRGGVLTTTGTKTLLLEFTPLPYKYRLRLQMDASLQATISKISFTQGS